MYIYTIKPTEFMRENASATCKVVSETLYGDEIAIVEQRGDWIKIKTLSDGYEGWVPQNAITSLAMPYIPNAKIGRLKAHLYAAQDTEFGPLISLPYGVCLKVEDTEGSLSRWVSVVLIDGQEVFIQRGDIAVTHAKLARSDIVAFSKQFLGLPYTWGGRSSFGFDCSGFCQMLYREMGILLPRDAKDQIGWKGFEAVSSDQAQAADLVFFGKERTSVSHVGMCIGQGEFIHATVRELQPYIRISKLDDPEWNGSGSLAFRAIRRPL